MFTANQLKVAAQMMGVIIPQIGLFACYIANIWHSPLALIIIFILPASVLISTYRRERHWLSLASKVSGRIVDRQKKMVLATQTEMLTVEYQLNGLSYTHYSYRNPIAHVPSVGDSVELLYNPVNPADAKERMALLQRVLPWIALTFSAIMLVVVALYVFGIPDTVPLSQASGH